jgi:hypothetical protein
VSAGKTQYHETHYRLLIEGVHLLASRKIDVYDRAIELAQTGTFPDWLSVEHALRDEGYSDARSKLDRTDIRDRLDSICQTAIAEPEASRRTSFQVWLNEMAGLLSEDELKRGKSNISIRNASLYISGYGYDSQVTRKFGSSSLVYSVWVDRPNEGRYKIGAHYDTEIGDFESSGIAEFEKMLDSVITKCRSLASDFGAMG